MKMVQKIMFTYEGAKYLIEQFHQDNSKGIDYNLTKPKEILVVYSVHPTTFTNIVWKHF